MQIKSNYIEEQNINSRKIVSNKGGREVFKTLSNPDSLISTIVLESFVTGGRAYRGFSRGGFPEFRERLTDDVVSAIFWMKGVDMFNKIGNTIGKHILKLPETEFDVGKDALRTPFNNLIEDLAQNPNITNIKGMEKKLATFKFTKIITSTVLAIGFVGFMLPKMNQAITEKIMTKIGSDKSNKNTDTKNKPEKLFEESIDDFSKKITNNNNKLSFKGGATGIMTSVAHALENNKIVKMLTCDLGILTGRVKTSRNKDEGNEFFFRDLASCFFYFASTPLVYKSLQKISGSSDLTTIDPVAAKQISNNLITTLQTAGGSMKTDEFKKATIGILDDVSKQLLEKLPFSSDVISLNKLKEFISDEQLIQKATDMACLQPSQANIGKVLTKQQVMDVLKNGSINTPEFMQKVYTTKFGEALTNPYKFISKDKITGFRDNIDKYVQNIVETANKNNGIIDEKLVNSISKKGFLMSAGFRIVAMGISAFALGYAIPKIQYAMTAKRTGDNKAPGLRKYEENNK